MQTIDLPPTLDAAAIDLWRATGLTRPWNDAASDIEFARRSENSTVLAAVADGTLVGTVMVGHDGHRGWVYYLAVAPDHQRAGLGRALMHAAEEWLSHKAVPKIRLMVRSENTVVLNFYERLGYTDQDVTVLGRDL